MTRPVESARRRAREAAFRVAYQADIASDSYAEAWRTRQEDERLSDDQSGLVADVVRVLDTQASDVDAALVAAAAHWPLARMAATDRSVLRTAVAELMGRPGTPARVVIDEAVDIARRYGSEGSPAFVNGVLDHVARALRPAEF
ncbi:MAG: transcription antitermination factor NusB [Candidatus Eisenbacteria bacterium]